MRKSTLFFCICCLIAQLSFAQVTTYSDNGTLTNTAQTAIKFENASIRVRSTATAVIPLLSTGAASITFTLKGGDGGAATWDGTFTDRVAQGGEGGTVTFTMLITPENEGKKIFFYQGKHGETDSHPIIASGGGGASTALVDHNGTLLALAGGGGGGCAVEIYQSSGRPGGVATAGHATSCESSGKPGENGTTGSNTRIVIDNIAGHSSDILSVYAGGGGGLSGISGLNTGIHSGDITGKAASDGGWGGYHPEGIFYSGPNCNQDFPFQIPGCSKTETRDRSRGGTGYSGGGAGGPWLRDSFRSSCSERMWSLFGAGGGGGGYDGGGAGSPERGGGGGSSYVDPEFTNSSFKEGGLVTNSQNGTVVYQVNYDTQPPVAICKNTSLLLGQGSYITNDGSIGFASGVNGQATLDPTAIDGGSTDDLFIKEMTVSKQTFTCADLGENTIVLTVKDGNGNTDSCSAQVTVVDTFAPTITRATSSIINAPDFGMIDLGTRTSLTITPPELNFVDNCGVISVVQAEPFTVTCSDVGTTVVKEVVATDASGNQNVVSLNYSITSIFINKSTIYVNANQADDSGDGRSWATAKKYLNSALALLDGSACYTGKQIWVAGGTYYPDEGTNQTDNDRQATFLLGNEVAIYGGFSGNETNLDQRDYANNPTILSGDLQKNDQAGLNRADNAYTVVTSLSALPFLMDGFTISGGNSNGASYETSVGGGVGCFSSSSFRNCIFSGNSASLAGGAFFSINAEVEFINCIFSGNTADSGGALYNDMSKMTLINCTLSGNSAATEGGAISNIAGGTLSVKNSIIWNNRAQGTTTAPQASILGNATYATSLVANISSSGIVANEDPLFVKGIDFTTAALPTTAGDFHAQLGIVKDAGDKSYNDLDKDLDGKTRTLGQIDLGPYEYGYNPDYFVTTWRTTTVNERITLPLIGDGYFYFIDWDNDGIIDYKVHSYVETNSNGRIHTFAKPGIHTIVIEAFELELSFKNSPDKDKIVSIEQWGKHAWSTMNNAFNGCSNLVINAKDVPNLRFCSDLTNMFTGATSLDYDFSQWDVSKVTNMEGMFDGVTLSEENYDKLLNTWSNLDLKSDVVFSAGNSKFCLGEPGRTKLIESFGWTITDGGPGCETAGCTDDKTPPVPDVASLPEVTAACAITKLTPPTATDNCTKSVTVIHDAVFPITENTLVTWTYTDASGNFSTQTQNVVIKDLSAPVPDVVTLPEVTAACNVTELTPPTATDNCTESVTVTHDAVFPITENTLVTWTYTDASGNFSTQTQNVAIKDLSAPVPDVASLPEVTAACAITELTSPTATDNCTKSVTVTHDAVFPITENTLVTWTYTDASGNFSTQTQNVAIKDLSAPVPDVASLPEVTAACTVTELTPPTATDNCTKSVTVTHDAVFPITENTLVTWTYTDASGNFSTQTQNVMIKDLSAPVPDMVSLPEVTAEAQVTELTPPGATDNCTANVTVTHDAVFPITENTLVTWTYTDAAGNFSTQTQNVVITSTKKPVIALSTKIVRYAPVGSELLVAAGAILSDEDSATLSGVSFTFAARPGGTSDELWLSAMDSNFALGNGISTNINRSTGTLRLSGLASIATYQAVLRRVFYAYTGPVATAPGQDRNIDIVAKDERGILSDAVRLVIKFNKSLPDWSVALGGETVGTGETLKRIYGASERLTFDTSNWDGSANDIIWSVTSGNALVNITDQTLSFVGTGTINVEINLPGTTNFFSDSKSFTIQVDPKLLRVTPDNKTKVYGESDPAFTANYSGFENGDDSNDLGGSLNLTREPGEDVGVYTITAAGYASPNYTISYTPGSFEITKANLTVTADRKFKVFGTPDPVLSYSAEGFVNGENISVLSGILKRKTGEDVGVYDIEAGDLAGSNYSIAFNSAQLTITPATITGIRFEDKSFVYDGTAKSLAITGSLPAGANVNYANNSRTDVGTQEVTATITGSNYTSLVLTADLTITPASITGITFENDGFVYDGTFKSLAITGSLPAGASLSYTNNSRTDVGTQEVTATITGSNFTTLVLTADLTITPATITGITFENDSFVYDGTFKSLAITGSLPAGTSVSYADNSRTDVGTQEVTATITGDNYTTLVLTADLTVTPATIIGVTFEDTSFIYDGTAKSLAITGSLPAGTSVSYADNSRTDVGTQEVTATINGSNYTTLVLAADLIITPATIMGITLVDDSFMYDGISKSLAITGSLPAGTSVSYINNSRTDVGTLEVTATITGSNYTPLVLTADLRITPATITGITFEDKSFVYDGNPKSLAITGSLPIGNSVSYVDNSRTEVGTQEVTATITGSNYTPLVLTADLRITPATITGITFEDKSFVYDGNPKSLAITGSLPIGTSVSYVDNSRKEVGTQEVTATITGSNYIPLVLTADLTITPATIPGITFEDKSFVYDGTAKSLAITGSLPDGTSVSYTNNSRTDVGTQEVTATITGSNFTPLVLTADLRITPATITGITFEDKSFVYSGTPKQILVENLPQGANVSYTGNDRIDAGIYALTATVTRPNYNTVTYTATLEITKAPQAISFDALPVVSLETDPDFQLEPTASSGLPVSYSYTYSSNVPAAMVSETGFVSLVQSGTITITASQVGNDNYQPATPVSQQLVVTSADASITRLTIGDREYLNPDELITYVIDCGEDMQTLEVTYDTEANATGNMPKTFSIPVPKPGIYRTTLVVTSQDGTVSRMYRIEIHKRFLFEEIVVQKFNNTLVVNKNPQTNGNYRFTGYRWYKNGRLVGNEQYFSEGDASTDMLDPLASYRVELITAGGDVLSTCEFTIELKASGKIRMAPNPVLATASATLFADFEKEELKDMKISILSLQGTLVDTFYTSASSTTVQMPAGIQAGLYVLVCQTKKQTQTIQFIVY